MSDVRLYPILRDPNRKYAGEEARGYSGSIGGGMDDLINSILGFRQGMSTYASDAIRHLSYMDAIHLMEKGFSTTRFPVTTTAQRAILATQPKAYILVNPSSSVGTTISGTLLASASRSGSGNTQASSIGVANYMNMHLFLDITVSGGGTIVINTQAKDPLSGAWANTQNDIFSSPSAVGTYYAGIGSLGVATDFAISWSVSAGSSTFSLGYVLKDGIMGSSTGLSRTIYLGANSGIISGSNSPGFPLLEGDRWAIFVKENTEIWAIAQTALNLNIIEMQ
jgi:hypothetical protein